MALLALLGSEMTVFAGSKFLHLSNGRTVKIVSCSKTGLRALRVVLPNGRAVIVPRSMLSAKDAEKFLPWPVKLEYGKYTKVKVPFPVDWDPYKFRDWIKVRYDKLKIGEYNAVEAAWKRLLEDDKVTRLDQLFLPEGKETMKYYYFVPEKKNLLRGEKVPLVVFLHGMTDHRHMNRHPQCLVFVQPEIQKKHPCYFLAPLSNRNGCAWHYGEKTPSEEMRFTVGIIDDMLKRYPNIDKDRIYVTGLSSGGYGAWAALALYPGKFAGALPIAAGGEELLPLFTVRQKVALWAFCHPSEPQATRKSVVELLKKLASLGADARYSEYRVTKKYDKLHKHSPNVPKLSNEHAAQNWAYAIPKLIPWLFSHRRDKAAAVAAAAKRPPLPSRGGR